MCVCVLVCVRKLDACGGQFIRWYIISAVAAPHCLAWRLEWLVAVQMAALIQEASLLCLFCFCEHLICRILIWNTNMEY